MVEKKIKSAFAAGSGIPVTEIATVSAIAVFVLVVSLSIAFIFKRLSLFKKDDDAQAMWRDTLLVFLVIFFSLLIISSLVYW